MDVQGIRKENVEEGETPGSYAFRYQRGERWPSGMKFVCPCGCGSVRFIPIRPSPDPNARMWNGSLDEPTLTGQVIISRPDNSVWVGKLVNGVWKTISREEDPKYAG